MLTWADLDALCKDSVLVLWRIGGRATIQNGRCLYMLADVHQRFSNGTWPGSQGELPKRTSQRRSAMRQAVERYVLGHAVLLDRELKELGTKSANATMRGFWEFRSGPPMEETRLFGFFARPGAFVATDFQPRGNYQTQAHWDAQCLGCKARWAAIASDHDFMVDPWPVRLRADLAKYLERTDD